jgi:inner membrane protein
MPRYERVEEELIVRFPLLSKGLALAAVVMGLTWALASVQSLVQERQSRQRAAESSVANSLAGSQTLVGPTLVRACTETWPSAAGPDRQVVMGTQAHVLRLPATHMQVDAGVEIVPRYKGIFKVNGYVARMKSSAQWDSVEALTPRPEHEGGKVSCDRPIVAFSVTDARGIQVVDLRLDGQALAVQPGSELGGQQMGFHADLPEASTRPGDPVRLLMNLELAGTRSIAMAPVADTTTVSLSTNWRHPAFGGRFLPSERHVGDKGFDATWKVTSLATTAQQEWVKGSPLCALHASDVSAGAYAGDMDGNDAPRQSGCVESFGVDFMDPVNPYVLGDRATKYGLLFIALTFVGVGLVEALRRLRVHPVQYLLVGAALAVFFLLLVSLSEHLAFGYAYLAASAACTALLSFYGVFVLRGMLAGLIFGAGIASLFATLYALLQMEQTALVLGSVLLFAVLALIMVATRKLDWYELIGQVRQEAA